MIDERALEQRLCGRFGLAISAGRRGHGLDECVYFRVVGHGIDKPNGFAIELTGEWRSLEAKFVPDSFARSLMQTVAASTELRRREFLSLSDAFQSTGIRSSVRIDDRPINARDTLTQPWSKFQLACHRLTDKSDEQRDAEELGGACLALVLSLLPIEELVSLPSEEFLELEPGTNQIDGLPEGAVTKITVNRYERRPANRAAAIAAHGTQCAACGFDFFRFYGDLGDGFIEIHHRTPVSLIGPNYIIDPVRDLVPLCANCHQMVHRRSPPVEPEQLRELLLARQKFPKTTASGSPDDETAGRLE